MLLGDTVTQQSPWSSDSYNPQAVFHKIVWALDIGVYYRWIPWDWLLQFDWLWFSVSDSVSFKKEVSLMKG